MNNEPQKLRESLWRRPLTQAERAELQAKPDVSADLELESRLSAALEKLPVVPVPSNFTSRLMQAVEQEETIRSRSWRWNWHALLPRIAIAAAVLFFAGLTFHQYEQKAHRTALARNVALIAGSQPLPSVEALQNYDAIRRMSQPARPDEELLALMQ